MPLGGWPRRAVALGDGLANLQPVLPLRSFGAAGGVGKGRAAAEGTIQHPGAPRIKQGASKRMEGRLRTRARKAVWQRGARRTRGEAGLSEGSREREEGSGVRSMVPGVVGIV
jgi:hypothetical protein